MKPHLNVLLSTKALLMVALLLGADGEPVRGAEPDSYWDNSIGVPGSDGSILAMAVSASGVVVGGQFGRIGGIDTGFIAQWDGQRWSGLGTGMTGGLGPHVRALATQGNSIFAGGVFSQAGDAPVANIARWDGSKWSALGTGIGTIVRALAVSGTDLYVGGSFSSAGGVVAMNIARWDGTNWHAVGSGLPGQFVSCLAASGEALYAGGLFTGRDDYGRVIKYMESIVKWDGRQWTPLGSGIIGFPESLLMTKAGLVAGGSITAAGGTRLNHIGLWDGQSWSALGEGLSTAPIGVYALAENHDVVYAGGFFWLGQGGLTNGLAAWDVASWNSLGSGLKVPGSNSSADVLALACNGAELYVGGLFTLAGGMPATNIAVWHIPRTLKTTWTGNQLALSWPAPDTNFVLEATENLGASNWLAVTQAPVLVGRRWTVTNEVSGLGRFYRLRQK